VAPDCSRASVALVSSIHRALARIPITNIYIYVIGEYMSNWRANGKVGL